MLTINGHDVSTLAPDQIPNFLGSAARPVRIKFLSRDIKTLDRNFFASRSGADSTSSDDSGITTTPHEILDSEIPDTLHIESVSTPKSPKTRYPTSSFTLQDDNEKKKTIKLLRNELLAMGHSTKDIIEMGKCLTEPIRDKHKKEREAARLKKCTLDAYKTFFNDTINMNFGNLTPIMLARARIKFLRMLQELQTPKGLFVFK